MHIWDYDLPKNWKPKTPVEWRWYLTRKINYGDFRGLTKKKIKEHFNQIKKYLDPGKRAMLKHFLKHG